MIYVDENDIPDNEWLNEITTEKNQDEIDSLKQNFRDGIVETNMEGKEIPSFVTNYLENLSVEQWEDILVNDYGPPFCIDEKTFTEDNVTESFLLSVRYEFIKDWFSHI